MTAPLWLRILESLGITLAMIAGIAVFVVLMAVLFGLGESLDERRCRRTGVRRQTWYGVAWIVWVVLLEVTVFGLAWATRGA